MKKTMKKVLAFALAAVVSLGSAFTTMAATSSPVKPQEISEKNPTRINQYVVNTSKNGTVALGKAIPTGRDRIRVAEKLPVKGKKYKVTKIKAKAFENCKKVVRISLPTTLKVVKKNAFTGCKNLKQIVIRGTKAFKIEKKAFQALNTKKMTVKVQGKMSAKAFKKLQNNLRKAGFQGKIKMA